MRRLLKYSFVLILVVGLGGARRLVVLAPRGARRPPE